MGTNQLHRVVVDLLVSIADSNLGDPKGHPVEAELTSDVHPPQFHVHSNQFHSSYTSAYVERVNRALMRGAWGWGRLVGVCRVTSFRQLV